MKILNLHDRRLSIAYIAIILVLAIVLQLTLGHG